MKVFCVPFILFFLLVIGCNANIEKKTSGIVEADAKNVEALIESDLNATLSAIEHIEQYPAEYTELISDPLNRLLALPDDKMTLKETGELLSYFLALQIIGDPFQSKVYQDVLKNPNRNELATVNVINNLMTSHNTDYLDAVYRLPEGEYRYSDEKKLYVETFYTK